MVAMVGGHEWWCEGGGVGVWGRASGCVNEEGCGRGRIGLWGRGSGCVNWGGGGGGVSMRSENVGLD